MRHSLPLHSRGRKEHIQAREQHAAEAARLAAIAKAKADAQAAAAERAAAKKEVAERTKAVAKKVAFVELRTHQRAPADPLHPAAELREMFYEYLTAKGEVQHRDRAPAPLVRDLRTALTAMGYGNGTGKGKGKGQ